MISRFSVSYQIPNVHCLCVPSEAPPSSLLSQLCFVTTGMAGGAGYGMSWGPRPSFRPQISYQLRTNFVPTSYQLRTNFVPTSHQLRTNFVPTSSHYYGIRYIFIESATFSQNKSHFYRISYIFMESPTFSWN